MASLYIQTLKFQHLNLLYIVQKRSNISISLVISYVVPRVYIIIYSAYKKGNPYSKAHCSKVN